MRIRLDIKRNVRNSVSWLTPAGMDVRRLLLRLNVRREVKQCRKPVGNSSSAAPAITSSVT
ncbi:hypothetical protein D3C76_1447550 [compost metagenome]